MSVWTSLREYLSLTTYILRAIQLFINAITCWRTDYVACAEMFHSSVINIHETFHKFPSSVNTAEKCLCRTDRPSLKRCFLQDWPAPEASSCCWRSENVPTRIRTDYSFSHFSCMPTPSKALECRGDIKTMFKSREDSRCEGNTERDRWEVEKVEKVIVRGYSCIEEMPVLSDINGSGCMLLGLLLLSVKVRAAR